MTYLYSNVVYCLNITFMFFLNNFNKLIRCYKLYNKLLEINRILPETPLFEFRNIDLVKTDFKRV